MALHDLEDQLYDHLKLLITSGLVYIYADVKKRNITAGTPPDVPELKIVIGESVTVGHYPVIRISSNSNVENSWLGAGVRSDRYFFNIDVDLRTRKKEIQDKAIMAMSNAVKNWLLHRPNLAQTIFNAQGATYYNSWCGRTALGVKGDGTIRTARFEWYCDVTNSYFYTGAEVSP